MIGFVIILVLLLSILDAPARLRDLAMAKPRR